MPPVTLQYAKQMASKSSLRKIIHQNLEDIFFCGTDLNFQGILTASSRRHNSTCVRSFYVNAHVKQGYSSTGSRFALITVPQLINHRSCLIVSPFASQIMEMGDSCKVNAEKAGGKSKDKSSKSDGSGKPKTKDDSPSNKSKTTSDVTLKQENEPGKKPKSGKKSEPGKKPKSEQEKEHDKKPKSEQKDEPAKKPKLEQKREPGKKPKSEQKNEPVKKPKSEQTNEPGKKPKSDTSEKPKSSTSSKKSEANYLVSPTMSTLSFPLKFGGHYRMELAGPEHYKAIGQLLKEHYLPDSATIRLMPELLSDALKEQEAKYLISKVKKDNLCLVVIDEKTNAVIGATICDIDRRDEPGLSEHLNLLQTTQGVDKRICQILKAMSEMSQEARLLEKHKLDKAFHCKFGVTDRLYRGQGIGFQMLDTSFRMAQTLGFKMFKMITKGDEAYRLAKKLNLVPVADRSLRNIKFTAGYKVFKDAKQDVKFTLLMKLL